jgi:hypothetical protein
MKTYQLKFLAWTFSAFLPPKPTNTEESASDPTIDYYALLGIPSNAKPDDIKKAYRKRSLELHPDKLRQRGMKYQGEIITEDEARSRFQQMKSAYDALSDPKKRQVYDALGHQGMDFVVNPSHAWDPHVLLGNLAKSSVLDRAKLMMLILVFFGLVLMQPILICAKIDQTLAENGGALVDSMWVVLFIPFWMFSIGFGVVMIVGKAILPLVQWVVFVIGVLLLTLKWDDVIQANYAIVFIPFYIWMALRWFAASKEMKDTRRDMSKMVTIDYIEKYILNEKKQDENGNDIEEQLHRTYNDLSEEERDEINESYIIVHVPPKQAAPGDDETSMEGDLDAIERSPEYQEALIRHREAFKAIQHIVLPEIPLIILVIIQLDMTKNWDWGLVFIPLWISMVMECCGGCYGFFCTSALAHIEVQEAMAAHFETKKSESAHDVKDTNGESEVKTDFDKVKENIDAAKPDDSEAVEKFNSEATADTAKDTSDSPGKTDVETAVVVEPKDDTKGEEKKDASKDDAFPDIEAGDDEDEFMRNMFSMDEDTFQYYQQAEQEAESKATEAQSKAIASFCNIIFQIIFAGLFVGKLNQVYDERDEPETEGTSSFSAFWIIFPLLLFAGCTVCCCFCAIFCAAEVDTHMGSSDEEGATDEQEAAEAEQDAVIIQQTPTSEGMELDIEGQAPTKVEAAPVEVETPPEKKDSDMDDLD